MKETGLYIHEILDQHEYKPTIFMDFTLRAAQDFALVKWKEKDGVSETKTDEYGHWYLACRGLDRLSNTLSTSSLIIAHS
ncbi:hypothetical protein PM082_014587 [Marasmius tenuissimus]|nr:hypothetical protein PM082_014587 [Marasmius tenuissimus]